MDKMDKEGRYLKYIFSSDERREMADRMARATIEQTEAQDELKAVKAQYDSRIKLAQGQANDLARKIEQGWEFRNTDCRIERDYTHAKVRVYREDTGEMIESRDMTTKERQLPIGDDCTLEFIGGGEEKEVNNGFV